MFSMVSVALTVVWLTSLKEVLATIHLPSPFVNQYSPQLLENQHEDGRKLHVFADRKIWHTSYNRANVSIFADLNDLSLQKKILMKVPLPTSKYGKDCN